MKEILDEQNIITVAADLFESGTISETNRLKRLSGNTTSPHVRSLSQTMGKRSAILQQRIRWTNISK